MRKLKKRERNRCRPNRNIIYINVSVKKNYIDEVMSKGKKEESRTDKKKKHSCIHIVKGFFQFKQAT